MKTTLALESLETRFALSAYTVEILDRHDLVTDDIEAQMRSAADFVMQDLAEFVEWKGTIDLRIEVRTPWQIYPDGVISAVLQVTPEKRNATLHEMLTGEDLYPQSPDVGLYFNVATDGGLKVYGIPAYFDPEPATYVPAEVPPGYFDFIGVLRHEVAHGIAYQFGTVDFSRHVTESDGFKFFSGPNVVETLGRPLPMSTFGGTHYGNYLLPDNPVTTGLMYQWGNYWGNRLDWGRLDLAVLRDVGLTTKNESALPLLDTMDNRIARVGTISSGVDENMPAGTIAATVGATLDGTTEYTFSLVAGWDSEHFRMDGNRVVTVGPLDHEEAGTRVVYVQMEDSQGVRTRGRVEIEVFDGIDTPSLRVPDSFWMVRGHGPLEGMSLAGDQDLVALVVVFSRTGTLESRVDDPSILSYVIRNKAGGTTLIMRGTLADLSRNFHNTFYTGNEDSLSVQMASGNRNLADVHVRLDHMWPRPGAGRNNDAIELVLHEGGPITPIPVTVQTSDGVMGPVFTSTPVPARTLTKEMRYAAFAAMVTRLQTEEIMVSEPIQRRPLFV